MAVKEGNELCRLLGVEMSFALKPAAYEHCSGAHLTRLNVRVRREAGVRAVFWSAQKFLNNLIKIKHLYYTMQEQQQSTFVLPENDEDNPFLESTVEPNLIGRVCVATMWIYELQKFEERLRISGDNYESNGQIDVEVEALADDDELFNDQGCVIWAIWAASSSTFALASNRRGTFLGS